MLPQARLVQRLQSIDAVKAIVGEENIFPLLVPAVNQYPAIVFQVLSDLPDNDAEGSSNDFQMRLRIACLGISEGTVRPYETVWQLAVAIVGDAEAADGPTGLSGWGR